MSRLINIQIEREDAKFLVRLIRADRRKRLRDKARREFIHGPFIPPPGCRDAVANQVERLDRIESQLERWLEDTRIPNGAQGVPRP